MGRAGGGVEKGKVCKFTALVNFIADGYENVKLVAQDVKCKFLPSRCPCMSIIVPCVCESRNPVIFLKLRPGVTVDWICYLMLL
jgi:hypothetical protein